MTTIYTDNQRKKFSDVVERAVLATGAAGNNGDPAELGINLEFRGEEFSTAPHDLSLRPSQRSAIISILPPGHDYGHYDIDSRNLFNVADLFGAVRFLATELDAAHKRIRVQADDLKRFQRDQPDPLGVGAIVELIDRVPFNEAGSYFEPGQVGVVHNPRGWYDDDYNLQLRFPGFANTFKVSSHIVRVIRAAQHAR